MPEKPPFDPSPIPEDRPLSAAEQTLIEWLIDHGTGDVAALRSQVPHTRVVGRCRCGCPTIDVVVSGAHHNPQGNSHIVADYVGRTAEDVEVGVMLWTTCGDISGLEITTFGPHDGAFSLPVIGTLKAF